jgi:hypothetical protein
MVPSICASRVLALPYQNWAIFNDALKTVGVLIGSGRSLMPVEKALPSSPPFCRSWQLAQLIRPLPDRSGSKNSR